jgi:hypothetical protein
MNLSGNNILSISEQTEVSFLIDLSLDNINGLCNLGFTGINQNVNFKLTNGKIFDPENKLIYTYNANENIKLSGNINSSGYDYYINDYYLSNINSKSYTKFDRFYLNTSGCTGTTEFYINGDRPNYKLNFNNFYYARENITGFISGNQNLNFKIYSGDIISPANSNFIISTIPSFNQNISGQKYNIIITPDLDTTKQLYLDKTGDFIFGLYTNFGKISGVFKLNSQYLTTGYINYFNVNKISETFSTEPGETNTDSYVLGADFVLGNETGSYSIDKNLSFIFEYANGYTGSILETININTGINSTLTGFISGSGYLSNAIIATGSGINLLNNQIVTGLINNNVSKFIYLNGFLTNQATALGSGEGYSLDTLRGSSFGFGNSSELNSEGNIAAIGGNAFQQNVVYIFSGRNNTWNQVGLISRFDNNSNFGRSLSLNDIGNKMIIGAGNDDNGSGAAYIYTGFGNNWNYQKLTGANNSYFGTSVALNKSGNIALVGGEVDNNGKGAVWIFTGNNLNYTLKQKLTGSYTNGHFGQSIAINDSGNVIVIGENFYSSGLAYIFTGNGNNWDLCKKIYPVGSNKFFPIRIGINGDGNSIIGNCSYGAGSLGHAYLFTGNGQDWNLANTFVGEEGLGVPGALAINSIGNKILLTNPNMNNNSGKAWIYTGYGNNWEETLKFSGTESNERMSNGFCSFNQNGNRYIIPSRDVKKVSMILDDISYKTITGQVSGFVENGILSYEDYITQNINGSIHTGYVSSIIATGIASGNYDLLLTGLTDIVYEKTFTGTFNIITGYSYQNVSGNLIPTGNINFKSGNYITNNKYTSGSNVSSNINQINISIEKRNFYDNYAMSGNLYITGRNTSNNLVTGIKIPVIVTGINPVIPNNLIAITN